MSQALSDITSGKVKVTEIYGGSKIETPFIEADLLGITPDRVIMLILKNHPNCVLLLLFLNITGNGTFG